MSEYNLFDLIPTLPFDSAVPDRKEHEKAIVEIKKKLENLDDDIRNSASQTPPPQLTQEKQFLEKLLDEDKKTLSIQPYEAMKAEKAEKVKEDFRNAYNRMKAQTVTEQFVKTCSDKSRLSVQSVEKILTELGFEIVSFDLKLPEYPPTTIGEIDANLAKLNKYGRENPRHAVLSEIIDLYDFVAYLKNGNLDDAEHYRTSPYSSDWNTVLSEYKSDNSGAVPEPNKTCVLIAAPASTTIFDTKEKKEKYDNYLKKNSVEMTEICTHIKALSEDLLRTPSIADDLIAQIENVFKSRDYALALYNDEAGFGKLNNKGEWKGKEPYIQTNVKFHVQCGYCGTNLPFDTKAERDNAQICESGNLGCGKSLYRQCKKPDCKQKVLVALDKCPYCGFRFDSASEFTKHLANADEARRKGNFDEARQHLARAQSADPSEKSRTDELASRISAEEKKYEKPINQLKQLITDRKFQAASKALSDTIMQFPGLNVADFEKQINSALSQANSAFNNAKRLSSSQQADECIVILNHCEDYKPAIDLLRATSPTACSGFIVNADHIAGHISISWTRSSERGITYQLVRKQGQQLPINEKDGEILCSGKSDTSFTDSNIISGRYYSYCVFAVRYGVYSNPVGKSVTLVAEAKNVRAEQIDKTIRLTWDIPKNSMGTTVRRTQNGQVVQLTNNAHGSFEDKNIEYGIPYTYTVCANYSDFPTTQGIDVMITPLVMVDSFNISVKHTKASIYKVSWSIKQNKINMRVLLNEQLVKESISEATSCEIEIPPEGLHTVTAMAYSGGNWIRSENSPQINTYTPCEIDKTESDIHEKTINKMRETTTNIELHLKLREMSLSKVVGFYYCIRSGDIENRWPGNSEIGVAPDIIRIGLDAYKKNDAIIYSNTARDESAYYISLFTIYNIDGKEIVSNPKTCRFDRPLEVNVLWKVSKSLIGGLRFSIEISGNRPITHIPELILCACVEHEHILTHEDPRAHELLKTEEVSLESPEATYSRNYDIKPTIKLKGMKLNLFEISHLPSEKYNLRWSKGFNGKV